MKGPFLSEMTQATRLSHQGPVTAVEDLTDKYLLISRKQRNA